MAIIELSTAATAAGKEIVDEVKNADKSMTLAESAPDSKDNASSDETNSVDSKADEDLTVDKTLCEDTAAVPDAERSPNLASNARDASKEDSPNEEAQGNKRDSPTKELENQPKTKKAASAADGDNQAVEEIEEVVATYDKNGQTDEKSDVPEYAGDESKVEDMTKP